MGKIKKRKKPLEEVRQSPKTLSLITESLYLSPSLKSNPIDSELLSKNTPGKGSDLMLGYRHLLNAVPYVAVAFYDRWAKHRISSWRRDVGVVIDNLPISLG